MKKTTSTIWKLNPTQVLTAIERTGQCDKMLTAMYRFKSSAHSFSKTDDINQVYQSSIVIFSQRKMPMQINRFLKRFTLYL